MKSSLAHFSINNPRLIFITTLLLTIIAGAFIPKIIIDTDPENMLPEDQQERVYHNQIKQRFSLYDVIVVGAVNDTDIFNTQSLAALKNLADGISQIEGVVIADLMALSTVDNISQEGEGTIRFEWLMKQAPKNLAAAQWINQQVDRLPLLQNTLVSQDDKASAIYVPIIDKDESYRISTEIQAIINGLDSKDKYYITGLPVAEDTFGYQMFVQMGISAPLAALTIFILMWVFFRNLKFIAAPMIIAMATVIITMGIMIGMGFTVHIMSSMIPIFLMPIAVVDSIHIMSEFADNYKVNSDRKAVIKEVISHLFKPMLFTSITSAVGFASLTLTPIPPVQVFGSFVAFGILLAFIFTIIFIPAYLVSLKPEALESLQNASKQPQLLQRWLPRLGKKSMAQTRLIVIVSVLIITVGFVGISKIQINDNPVRWFKQDHPIRVADKVLNQHFAGTYDAYLIIESKAETIEQSFITLINQIKNTDLLNEIEKIQQTPNELGSKLNQTLILLEDKTFDLDFDSEQATQLESIISLIEQLKTSLAYFQQPEALLEMQQLQTALQQSGFVGKTNSLVNAVKTVNRELRSGTNKDYRIPQTQAGVAQALLQYQSSHRPQDLWHLVTKDYSSSAMWVQLKSGDNQDMAQVEKFVNDYLEKNPLANQATVRWAGKTYLNKVWQDEMVTGMVSSLLSAFVAVLIMMMVLFRSVIFGVLAMLPLTITIIAIYGLIGWIGKDYDMPIAVLSALTLGLSVDFAIHFLQRARDTYRETKDFKITMQKMFEEPANAISRNAIVIALGFTPLLVAPLVPYITVGFFLASIMIVSALVTLLLLPIGLSLFKNRIMK